MTEVSYTAEELREFDNLSRDCASRDQVTRIMGRTRLRVFVDKHGKVKCDAMWSRIQADELASKKKQGKALE